MSATFYQVVGVGPWMVDYPHGDTKNHRSGDVFEARADNETVVRGLRQGRLRALDTREVESLRAMFTPKAIKPTPGLPPATPSPATPNSAE